MHEGSCTTAASAGDYILLASEGLCSIWPLLSRKGCITYAHKVVEVSELPTIATKDVMGHVYVC